MQARELATARTFAVTFEHGEDFFTTLNAFCDRHDIAQGYLPMFYDPMFYDVPLLTFGS